MVNGLSFAVVVFLQDGTYISYRYRPQKKNFELLINIYSLYLLKNYESWLAVDIVIAIITAYFFSGSHCIFISQFTDLKK